MSRSKEQVKTKTPLHLRLTAEDWEECCKTLNPAEIKVFIWIRASDPYGDRDLEINCSELGKRLGLHKSSISRALYALVQKGLLDSKYVQAASRDSIEHQIRDRLQSELGGQVEVVTAVGRIDLLTESEVVEIKNIDDWKEALGKILAYAAFFPNHNKRIHLFGKPDLTKLALAQSTCSEFGVAVTFEEVR